VSAAGHPADDARPVETRPAAIARQWIRFVNHHDRRRVVDDHAGIAVGGRQIHARHGVGELAEADFYGVEAGFYYAHGVNNNIGGGFLHG